MKGAPGRVLAADLALLAVTFVWGATFPMVKKALTLSSPLAFNAVRMSLAAGLLLLACLPWRRSPLRLWRAAAVLGFLLAAGYAMQNAGLELTTPTQSAFLTSVSVILVPILLWAVWRRRLPRTVWAGAGLALLGLYLLVAPAAAGGGAYLHGDVITLGCAAAFALQIIWLSEWAPGYDSRQLAAAMVLFAALFSWLGLAAAPHWLVWNWRNTAALWEAIVLTAVLATAVAFAVQTWAQQLSPPTHAAVIFAFEPVFASLVSVWGWHEAMGPWQWAGAGLIVVAMLVVESGKREEPTGELESRTM